MFIELAQKNPTFFFAVVITMVLSITIHELAHGVVAVWLGDRTPIESGHMTLNPAVHLGLFSVIALLLAGVAWGAMPVNPDRLRGRYGDALVSVAGPVSNALLALLSIAGLGLWLRFGGPLPQGTPGGNLQFLLWVFGYANVALAIFNLIPIPPLDGSRILGNFSQGFKSLTDQLNTSGASMVVFLLVFATAGNFMWPLAERISEAWLRVVITTGRAA